MKSKHLARADFLLGGMLAACFATDILDRLFSVGHASSETPLLQVKSSRTVS